MPFLWWIKPGDKVHCSRFHRLCLSAVWCTQAKFCVDGHVTAESSKVESPVAAPGWHLQIFEQSLYFNKDFSVSLWTPLYFIFSLPARSISSLSPDSPSGAWRTSWWAPRGLCGRPWWNRLRQTEAWLVTFEMCVVDQTAPELWFVQRLSVFQQLFHLSAWTHNFLQSLRLVSLPWVCLAGCVLREDVYTQWEQNNSLLNTVWNAGLYIFTYWSQ